MEFARGHQTYQQKFQSPQPATMKGRRIRELLFPREISSSRNRRWLRLSSCPPRCRPHEEGYMDAWESGRCYVQLPLRPDSDPIVEVWLVIQFFEVLGGIDPTSKYEI